jgi:hypothetical protein
MNDVVTSVASNYFFAAQRDVESDPSTSRTAADNGALLDNTAHHCPFPMKRARVLVAGQGIL